MRQQPHLTHFTYNTWMFEPKKHVKFVASPYLIDFRTVEVGNRFGILPGFELPLFAKLLLMRDLISGHNATGVSVLEINYSVSKQVQICLGGLMPNPGSNRSAGVVFELNLLGYDDHEPIALVFYPKEFYEST